ATASEVIERSTKLASLMGVDYDEWKTKLSAMNITEFRGALKLLSDMENARLNEMVKSSKKATNEDKISGGILVPTSKGESGALDKLAKAFTEGLGE
ncbi:hypothetical protein KA005_28120, partial [bacterium]|nr:hypothetical protein [bacterium]